MSDSIDTPTNVAANSEALPSADLEAGDVGPITDWEETIDPKAGTASNESAEADAIEAQEPQFSARVSSQVKKKDTTMAYSQTTLPDPVNAAYLPGAFFFLTLQYKDKSVNQVVAYDPYVKPGNKASDILAFYEANTLPYYEWFDSSATKKWEKSTNYYSGTYGGQNNPNKGLVSLPWPYSGKTNNSIANGVNIAFWATNDTQRGLFTSAPSTLFNKGKAQTYVMPLHNGSGHNFIKDTSKAYKLVESAQVDFYAMYGALG